MVTFRHPHDNQGTDMHDSDVPLTGKPVVMTITNHVIRGLPGLLRQKALRRTTGPSKPPRGRARCSLRSGRPRTSRRSSSRSSSSSGTDPSDDPGPGEPAPSARLTFGCLALAAELGRTYPYTSPEVPA